MLMVLLRLLLIGISLIYLSEIPTSEKVFFNARFAFYAMIFLDAINLYKSNVGFEKHYAGLNTALTGIITFLDLLGVLDIIVLQNGSIGANVKYTILKDLPHVSVNSYILTFSLVTMIISAAELALIFNRNRSTKSKELAKETVLET